MPFAKLFESRNVFFRKRIQAEAILRNKQRQDEKLKMMQNTLKKGLVCDQTVFWVFDATRILFRIMLYRNGIQPLNVE